MRPGTPLSPSQQVAQGTEHAQPGHTARIQEVGNRPKILLLISVHLRVINVDELSLSARWESRPQGQL